MAKIKILGNSFTITGGIKTDTLRTITKYYPNALKLTDTGTKLIAFEMKIDEDISAISNKGIYFTSTNSEGYPYATFEIPEHIDHAKRKDFVETSVGAALIKLNELEDYIEDFNTNTVAETMAMLNRSIEEIDG